MRARRQIEAEARALLLDAPVATWEASETPWAGPHEGAQVRTTGGRFVATFADPDDAKLAANAVRLWRELLGVS